MIDKVWKIGVTQDSHPFATACGKLGFEEAGYVEEEYFFTGTANVYEEIDEKGCRIIHENQPYCNRFLLRRPSDMSRFGGNITVEILNATAGMDLDRMWVCGAKELMRQQSVYVGITSKPDMITTLKKFDPVRYSDLTWKVEYTQPDLDELVDELVRPADTHSETGLIWDMLTDLAGLLRGEFLPASVNKYIYLTGWSQSTSYLRAYVRYLAFRNPSDRIYDGYFCAGGIHHFNQPLNQAGYANTAVVTRTTVDYMPVPYIALQTESECIGFGGYEARKADSDEPDMLFRRYDVAGATHDSVMSLLDYYAGDEDVIKINNVPQYIGLDPYPNDYPYELCFNVAYRMLFDWAQKGVSPMPGKLVEVGEDMEAVKDPDGNSLGGMRLPLLTYPVCRYVPYSHTAPEIMGGRFALFGHDVPFEAEELRRRYGSLDNYRKLIAEEAKRCADRGDLLPEDIEDCIQLAVNKARALGLA